MAILTNDDLKHLHRLAQLEPDSAQQDLLLNQINHIFEMIRQMQEVNTDQVEPLSTPLSIAQTFELRLRDDIVTQPSSTEARDLALRNAPVSENGYFLVPQVLD